jgi:hypothetical protein
MKQVVLNPDGYILTSDFKILGKVIILPTGNIRAMVITGDVVKFMKSSFTYNDFKKRFPQYDYSLVDLAIVARLV